MKPNQSSRVRLESLRRRKSRSVLQMIQTLEICAAGTKGDAPPPLPPCSIVIPEGIAVCGTSEESTCNDDDTFTSALCSSTVGTDATESDADTLIVEESPVAEPQKISTRRQRRAHDKSSANYSDFCDTDLSRQIEAMAFEIESAYENRHVKKSEHIIDQNSYTERPKAKRSYRARSTHETYGPSTNDAPNKSSEASLHNSIAAQPSKPIDEAPAMATEKSLHPLERMGYDAVPDLKPCDSSVSLFSNCSIDMKCNSSYCSPTSARETKTRNLLPQPNAEWHLFG